MFINAVIGGTPGKDCGGFCKFCYYRSADYKNLNSISLGCKYCPTNQIGCDYCLEVINDIKNGFRPLDQVISHVRNILGWYEFLGQLNYKDIRIITVSWADIILYPQIFELVSTLKEWGFQVHLGYTSGKGINDAKVAEELVSLGVDELSFSVFSMNPEIRRKWMGDKNPEESLKALNIFCENMEVNASTVVVPNVIDEEEIFRTCSVLEDWGVKSFILSRFANFKSEGLIFNNRPVIDGINTQSYEEFHELVRKVSNEFSFRVIGTPLIDPENNVPYSILTKGNQKHLKYLPQVTDEATIITSKLSLNPIKKIFELLGGDKVNVVCPDKDIGNLITHEDLASLDLHELKSKVIIPGGALVHDKAVDRILSKDGNKRTVIRGPGSLFHYYVEGLSKDQILNFELNSLKMLIEKING